MSTSSLQADTLLQPARRKRSFSLPSFKRTSGGERQEVASSAEEAVRVQKAAAWQWYMRGMGEVVVPTKKPPLPPPEAPPDDESGVDGTTKGGDSMNVLQKKPQPMSPPRAASRFKAEACLTQLSTVLLKPSDAPSTPLYDELELSGLRTQMADFVQRLQHQQIKGMAVIDHRKSKTRPNFPAPTAVSTNHQQTKALPSLAAAIATDHQLTKLSPSAAPVASTAPFHRRPFSALHRLLRKVVSGSILKSTKNSLNSSLAVYEPEVLPEAGDNNSQYHYHHYIHHHHHHHHYDQRFEESDATIPSRHRHSESSGIRPCIRSLQKAESDEGEVDLEESPMDAYLARRRRHSHTFSSQLPPNKADFDVGEEMIGEYGKMALPLQFPRRHKSERFSPNKIPIMVSTDYAQPAAGGDDEFDEELADIKSRRRYSAENYRAQASLDSKVEGGGKSGGGTYKLSGAAPAKGLLSRRRHSESASQRPEVVQIGKRTPSQGRPYPSAYYYVDMVERHIGVPVPSNTTPTRARLPPLYPQ